ncbi:MAG: MotA/TolQ/ExbB proton channel family protein [Marinirhabdus sp.]|nr:MotA/TolQ/ExbB proton channel family protein [Marinirhabdus sp.]
MRIPLNILSEGGLTFMLPLVAMIVLILVLLVVALIKNHQATKLSTLISHISLFALVWGFLGSVIGLIHAFDAIQAVGDVSSGMMAGGLKVALLTTLFGAISFLIGRFSMILITLRTKA